VEISLYPNNRLRVLEILNHPPGETFIQQHAIALNTYAPEIELCWAFTQTNLNGRLKQFDFSTTKCYAWPNYNLYPKWKQALVKATYFGKSLDALYKPQLNLLKKIKPDLVHFHFSSLAVKYAHLCVELDIPYTFSVRGSDIQLAPENDPDYVKSLQKVMQHAKAIHCVSYSLQHDLFEYAGPSNKSNVIRTAISDDWQTIERRPQQGLLIAIGRLNWRKGFPDLLLACKLLRDKKKNFQLIIIGEGPQRHELEFMIRDLNLTNTVTLAGKQSHTQIREWFSKAQLFVLSSIAEGFPNVVAEAMMAGVPVLTSNCDGIPELIKDQKNAFVYETGNVNHLTDQLEIMLEKSNLNELINNAQQLSKESFSHRNHAIRFKQLWQ
jgi:glycosyltransferase involved in cell wall biosynthesis